MVILDDRYRCSCMVSGVCEGQVPDRSLDEKAVADSFGSVAPVRDCKMQAFIFAFLPVGICDPRMTAIAGLHFQTLFGERPFAGVDRSLARKSANDAFGS